jgi:hypothetical protein
MDRLQARDGISHSEQARRALAAWLPTKGVLATTSKPRPSSRKARA